MLPLIAGKSNMKHDEREKLVFDYIRNGDWDKAIAHAKHVPSNWDIWQRLPSAAEDGMPNDAIHKVLDHLDLNGLNNSSFLYEMSQNLMGHHDTPTVKRLANAANSLGGSYLEQAAFTKHPNYKLSEDEQGLQEAFKFWNAYERKVHPSHFAAVASLHSGQPEIYDDHRGSGSGLSDDWDLAIPHLRDYAKKTQDAVLNDHDIYKRNYNGEPYIKLYRGVGGHYAKAIRGAAKFNPKTQEHDHKYLNIPVTPFSSWTTDREMAEAFARGRGVDFNMKGDGLLMAKWVPVRNILHSGVHSVLPGQMGAHPNENEFVVAHPTGKIKVHTNEFQYETLPDTDHTTPEFKPGVKREKAEKGLKDKAVALGVAAAMMGMPQTLSTEQQTNQFEYANPTAELHVQPLPGLKYIEMIESSGGKNTKHKLVTSGLNAGTKAIGKYGLMPLQVLETIRKEPKLAEKYPDFVNYHHVRDQNKIAQKFKEDPNFENEIANTHWQKLHSKFDGNESKMAHAWLNGIQGTIDASLDQISNHDYVKKYKKYKKMMQLEIKPAASLKKADGQLPPEISNIREFQYVGNKTPDEINNVKQINQLIDNRSFHEIPSVGQFTRGSFVIGTNHDNAWLIKIDDGHRPAIMSAKAGLQTIKEVAFYEIAKEVFGLGEYVPYALLGEIKTINENKPAAAIKMLGDRYKLAVDQEDQKPGSMKGILEKYRKSGLLHRMGLLLYVLGDGDSHGRNVMTDGYLIRLIDHGSSFADEKFDPAKDQNIFIPYVLRVGRIRERMSPAEKLEKMPKIDNFRVKEQLKSWILSIDSHSLAQKLNSYQIDPKPIIDRLKKLQNQVSQGGEPDQVINQAWVGAID